jgi:acyl phosphate:glycerol-3-phosphate acyltransferase
MIYIYLLFSYFMGTIMTGYFVVKMLTGQDIRMLGSGNVGARNVGRVIGKKGFILTVIGDVLKGVIVVLGAKQLDFSLEWQILVMLAVVVGHIWPITLQFKGGKGIATYLGALLVFDYKVLLAFAVIFIVLYLFMKRLTVAGLTSFLFIPITMILLKYSINSILLMTFVILGVIFVHRQNVRDKIIKWQGKL